jgi:hypothetical protein
MAVTMEDDAAIVVVDTAVILVTMEVLRGLGEGNLVRRQVMAGSRLPLLLLNVAIIVTAPEYF